MLERNRGRSGGVAVRELHNYNIQTDLAGDPGLGTRLGFDMIPA
jgi:hypothetical protein